MGTYRLSHIQKNTGYKIEEMVHFLSENGFEYEALPSTEITEDAKRIIDYNFSPSDKTKAVPHARKQESETIPVEIKILEAVNKEKLLIERIIGFTDYSWKYLVSTFKGECTQPEPFDAFDEVICEILLQGNELSLQEIGSIIGLDSKNDPGAYEVMVNALKPLTEFNKDGKRMVDGDESLYWLTDLGREYAQNGVKYNTFKRSFEIYWDVISGEHLLAKSNFQNLVSEKNPNIISNSPSCSFDELLKLAETQAPEIHLPSKGFKLLSAEHQKTEGYQAKVWVCFIENFRDNSTRTIVYDEGENKICHDLSEKIDSLPRLKDELLQKLIETDETVEETIERKSQEQSEIEKVLINQQDEIDNAISSLELEKVSQIKNTIEQGKIHFNTLEFELELKSIFNNSNGNVWIISPWIKKYAFSKRKPFIEKYLKKGGRVFIAFSKPENGDSTESNMVDSESMKDLQELELNYNNFFYCELPQFHYKNVWLIPENGDKLYYNGSFNILSFFVNQNQKYVRQEKMAKHLWNEEINNEFSGVFNQFGAKYINRAIDLLNDNRQKPPEIINEQFIAKLKAIGKEKLKPFESNDFFADKIDEFNDIKSENINYFRKISFKNEIARFNSISQEKKKIHRSEKSTLLKKFKTLRDKYEDLVELQIEAYHVQELIESIEVLGSKNFKRNHSGKKKRRK